MYCKKCGSAIKEGNLFCTNCGTGINENVNNNKKPLTIKLNTAIVFIILIILLSSVIVFIIVKSKSKNIMQNSTANEETEFQKLYKSAKLAQSLGITVNAGHGLNYKNVSRMHEITNLYELNIGHSIISRAIFIGLDNAVKEMLKLV